MAPLANTKLRAAVHALVVLLCAALTICCTAGDVVTYGIPAFNATTAGDFVVVADPGYVSSSDLLFGPNVFFPEFNSSEGFLVLSQAPVNIWRAGAGGDPDREASFHTSFTVVNAAPAVAFVVLKDTFPPSAVYGSSARGVFRGAANYTALAGTARRANTTGALAVVEVGPVMAYGPDTPAPGLNVTVTPRGVAPAGGRAVWIEFNAAVHRLSVYVAGAGEPRPVTPLLHVPLGANGWRWTTENAIVGFFAGKISDIIVGVRNWDMTLDNISGKKGTAWWVILLAVLGSVAATAIIVSAVVVFRIRRRRRQTNMESKI